MLKKKKKKKKNLPKTLMIYRQNVNSGSLRRRLKTRTLRLIVSQDVRQVAKVTVKEFADAFMVLKSKVIVVALGGGQVDEAVQWERETLSV